MRVITLLTLWVLSAAALPAVVWAGDVHGQLTITRVLTRQRVVMPVHQVRGIAPHRPDPGPHAINEWERVVVYLEKPGAPPAASVTATIDQVGQRFDPEMVVVPAGSVVSFPNSDPIFHNVFSLSRTREFDLGFYPAGETRTVQFDEPGVVQVYCHLHSDMSAAIFIVPNAWYTRTDDQGRFTLEGVDPGTYQLIVWHKSGGFFRQEVRVPATGSVNVSMEIPLEVPGTSP